MSKFNYERFKKAVEEQKTLNLLLSGGSSSQFYVLLYVLVLMFQMMVLLQKLMAFQFPKNRLVQRFKNIARKLT